MTDRLTPDEILSTEFEYIAQTAFQAHEDRARVTTFYLISAGTFVAAILGAQVDDLAQPFNLAFAALFAVLSAMGLLTLLQLVRLREAWFESVTAMNQIKEYYVEHLTGDDLQSAFRWRMKTIPSKFKRWSVAYLLALQVSVLGGGTMGAAVFFVGLYLDRFLWWQAGVAGLIFVLIQMWLQRRLLRN
jgi:hypothetical protein